MGDIVFRPTRCHHLVPRQGWQGTYQLGVALEERRTHYILTKITEFG